MINDNIDPFINAYRDSLDRTKDLEMQNLQNTRMLQHQGIMSGANKAGMMYSNFPERSKLQYDVSTYEPAVTKVQQSYQTGLDKLRSNTVDLTNQLKDINDAIADLNETAEASKKKAEGNGNNTDSDGNPLIELFGNNNFYDGTDEERSTSLQNANVGAIKSNDNGGVNYYDAEGKPIRFGTYAKRLGAQSDADVLYHAYYTMPKSDFMRLYNIYKARAAASPDGVFDTNTGKNHQEYTYDDISDDDANLLNSSGLRLK